MVDLTLLQSVSYIAGALGVCVAAFYYVQILRNTEREKRRQTIMQRLPTYNKDLPDAYYYLRSLDICKNQPEWLEKYGKDHENLSKLFYVLGIYNTIGILYQEGLMSLDDIHQFYHLMIIEMFERFWWVLPNNRLNDYGENIRPWFYKPLEHLYRDLKRMEPTGVIPSSSPEERRKLRDENVWSKLSKEEFLASVMK